MVVEELIAKLGFRVDGVGEIRKFDGALKNAKTGLSNFGRSMNVALRTAGLLVPGLRGSALGAAMLSRNLGRSRSDALLLAGAMTAVTYTVTRLGLAFIKSAGQAAQMRRSMQDMARVNRTTAGRTDNIARGFEALGMTEDDAKSFVGSIAEQVNKAILDRKGGGELQSKWGINTIAPNGVRRDSAEVTLDVIKNYLDRQEKARGLRDTERGTKGARSRDAGKKASSLEVQQTDFAEAAGISRELAGKLMRLQNWQQYAKLNDDAARRNPTQTKAQEDRAAENAENYRKMVQSIDGLASAITNLQQFIASKLFPPTNALLDQVQAEAKKRNWMNSTAGEVSEREKAKRAAGAVSPELDAARSRAKAEQDKSPGGGAGSLARWLFGLGTESDNLIEAWKRFDGARKNHVDQSDESPGSGQSRGTKKIYDDAAAGLLEAVKKLNDVQVQNQTMKGAAVKEDHRVISDVGNDKRNMPITVHNTVTVSGLDALLEKIASGTSRAIMGAVSTKAANTSTGALNTP